MKRFSLKFMLFATLCLFSSFIYADGVFSKYYNHKYHFSVNVPLEKFLENYDDGTSESRKLEFVKNSSAIPSRDYFEGSEAMSVDGINILDKNTEINIFVRGAHMLNTEDLEEEIIKSHFEEKNLDYNLFIKKYYNGKFPKFTIPKPTDRLKYDYNETLFILGDKVAYNTFGKNFYVISYIENNKIIYRKVCSGENGGYVIFEAYYPAKAKKLMDKIIPEMTNSIEFLK